MASCQNTSKTPAIDMANFDLSVAPDADFYQYATGGWQKNNPLKPEYSRYGSFDVLRDNAVGADDGQPRLLPRS